MILAIVSGDETVLAPFWRELREVWGLAAFRDIESLRGGLSSLSPSVVLIDRDDSRLKDMRSLRSLCRRYRHTPFVIISRLDDVQSELEFLRAGVRGLLHREADPAVYRSMLAAVLKGEMWFSRRAVCLFLEEVGLVHLPSVYREGSAGSLSTRELQVVRMVITGASNRQIADSLHITVRTVKAHLSHIFAKLGITQRSQLFSLEETLLGSSSAAAQHSSSAIR